MGASNVPPVVSVVIPTHNRCELLRQAVHSVLAQEAVDLEVLVVDDASTDRTSEAIHALNDGRVTVLRNEQPVRVAAARNRGAAAARGSWIAFLDDDDLWSPQKLTRQMQAAQASGRSWIYAGAVEIDARGFLIGGEPPPSPAELAERLIDRNMMPAGCSNVVVRADLFRRQGGFDVKLRHLTDWAMWLKLIRCGLPACVPLPLVAYRIHNGQATLDPRGMIAEGRILSAEYGADLNSIRRWLAWSHLRRGERARAALAYTRAALAGDVPSLARAAGSVLHPDPLTLGSRAKPGDREWSRAAQTWLKR